MGDFIRQMPVKARGKFLALVERLCQHGEIRNGDVFHRLNGSHRELWEFRIMIHGAGSFRVIAFQQHRHWYLTDAFEKKRDDSRDSDFATSHRLRAAVLETDWT